MAKTSAAKGASMTFTPHRKKPTKPRQPRSTRRARTAAARPWPCKCTRCANETTTAKQICCGASSAVNCLATTQHAGIATCTTLVDSDINDKPNLWSTSGPPASVADMSPRQHRILGYRKLFRLLHNIGRVNVQVALPSCCRRVIAEANPDLQ